MSLIWIRDHEPKPARQRRDTVKGSENSQSIEGEGKHNLA